MAPSDARAQSGGDSGSSKRKNASERNDRSHQRRVDRHTARAIPIQQPEAALKEGELDLQAFVAAHEFEIRSLEQSMATSKATGMTRAFQKVPRGLRRRTASHNPKRVPKRLRAKAMKEMGEDNTPKIEARRRKPRTTRARIRSETAKRLRLLAERKKRRKSKQSEDQKAGPIVTRKPRPKIRRNALNEPPRPPAKFRKRQLNKTWLPTHAWHAKRARMTEPKNPLWRFAIPLTPNEKIYRPTHRAQGNRGAVVWDMSYMSTIALYGNAVGMHRVMKRLGVAQDSCWNEKGRRWRMGVRSWTGLVSRETKDGRQQIAPVTILWNPPSDDLEKLSEKVSRQALFRVHPSAFFELFNELLRLSKMETPQLYIEDLRFEIGSIDLSGPSSTEALHAILTPAKTPVKSKHAELFQSLKNLSNPASLPPNAVLSFLAQDPRLRYPPRRAEVNGGDDPEEEMKLLSILASWPAEENLQPYSIFDRNARHTASCLPSQKALDRRRTKAISGSFLKPISSDPPIPVLLVASRTGSGTQVQGTWTLLAPWKCIMPFWYCLVHCPLTSGANPRFAGMNEIRQVAFERGQPWFPADYLATDAGVDWEVEQRRLRHTAWQRRPKSKRVEWKSLDLGAERKGEIGDGLACDFEYLFRLGPIREEKETRDEDTSMQSASEDEDGMDVDEPTANSKPATTGPSFLKLLHGMSKDGFSRLLSPQNTAMPVTPVPANAILNVRISILGRGVVGSCARIYRFPPPPTPTPTSTNAEVPATIPPPQSTSETSAPGLPHDLRSQWLARMPSSSVSKSQDRRLKPTESSDLERRKSVLAAELTQPFMAAPEKTNLVNINGHHPLVPNVDDLIGFVTTGSFSLSEGCGVAIGSVAVEKVLPDVKANAKEGKLCIVRNAGENVGWLARWEAI